MNDQITLEVYNHLVNLAALELSPEQAEYLRRQLNNQLQVIEQLKAIALEEDLPISLHGVSYDRYTDLPLREDILRPFPDAPAILAQAPQSQDGLFNVPDIPHTTL